MKSDPGQSAALAGGSSDRAMDAGRVGRPVGKIGEPTPYDIIQYPPGTHPQTHPSRLAAAAMYWGLEPGLPHGSRILEIGCGDGSNLIPVAFHNPGCQCLGIDLAKRPIESGRQVVDDLGLENIRLLAMDLADLDGSEGTFDYVIAHGVYSWVPEGIREALLALCSRCLAPQGVAFISFNALPGSHPRLMIREMLLQHVGRAGTIELRVREARAFLGFLRDGSVGASGFRGVMAREYDRLLAGPPGQMFHDEMAEEHTAFYFTDFVGRAAAAGLDYLGDVELFESAATGFPAPVQEALAQTGGDRIRFEQYLDYLKLRSFRQALLCRAGAAVPNRDPAATIRRLHFSAPLRPLASAPDLSPGVEVEFQTLPGRTVSTDSTIGKAMLAHMAGVGIRPLTFDELAQVAATVPDAPRGDELGAAVVEFLQRWLRLGLVEPWWEPPRTPHQRSVRPEVSRLARYQAARGLVVSTAYHQAVDLSDPVLRRIIETWDGTRDFGEGMVALRQQCGEGEISDEGLFSARIEKALRALERIGLLTG